VPIVFGPVMNVIASTLANWWRSHPGDLDGDFVAVERQTGDDE